jgi:hypothetical protein
MAISSNGAPFALNSMRRLSSSSVHRFRSGVIDCVAPESLANLFLAFKIAIRPRTAPMLLRNSAAIEKLDLPAALSSRSRLSAWVVHLLLLFAGTAQPFPSKEAGRRSHSVRLSDHQYDEVTATRRMSSCGRIARSVLEDSDRKTGGRRKRIAG